MFCGGLWGLVREIIGYNRCIQFNGHWRTYCLPSLHPTNNQYNPNEALPVSHLLRHGHARAVGRLDARHLLRVHA